MTSVQAEARGLCTGLEVCRLLGHAPTIVEGDSKILIEVLRGYCSILAAVLPIIRRIRQISDTGLLYQHIYREGNAVADGLASLRCESNGFCLYLSFQSSLRTLKGLYNVDRLLVGNFRYVKRPSMAGR